MKTPSLTDTTLLPPTPELIAPPFPLVQKRVTAPQETEEVVMLRATVPFYKLEAFKMLVELVDGEIVSL